MSATDAPAAAVPVAAGASRVVSLDLLRGAVVAIMALDHAREFFSRCRFEPEQLLATNSALFFTLWITHFCAPLFFFLAGVSAFLYGRRGTPAELRRFLWTRGLWLVVVEFTLV